MKVIRLHDPVNLTWKNDLEPILTQLNMIFYNPEGIQPHNLHYTARALLLLLKEGKKPTVGDVLKRIRQEDDLSPLGSKVRYDEGKWLGYVNAVINGLKTDDPRKALNL